MEESVAHLGMRELGGIIPSGLLQRKGAAFSQPRMAPHPTLLPFQLLRGANTPERSHEAYKHQ